MGWLTIWNQARANSRITGNRLEGPRDTIGDAYRAFFEKIRYCTPINDSNRARWPIHPI
ncbi:hypothetical protein [Falsihalocynthiibacter arcticus]|uniref:hypothetical protein n=1 Tax=Falsihalocynthiibacter arcticus TaxID=1579316 RepID=UPI0014706DE8|nr:hypothetical protein [Falsihalocynthiibacter arcticus]